MKKKKIVLDAGHGRDTYRKTGSKGVPEMEEFDFNSTTVRYAKELAELNGFEVILTQPLDGDDVPLVQRTNLVKNKDADMLISFHADASSNPDVRGHWCFFWYGHEPSGRLALLWDKYADKLMNQTLDRNTRESVPGTWSEFHMCREPVKYGIPSILAEHAFMTNRKDLELLLDDDFRKSCAEVAVRAACDYFGMPFSNERINIQQKIDILVHGVNKKMRGYLIDNSSFLPLRAVGESIGANIEWDNISKTAYVNDNKVDEYYLIENTCYVGLREVSNLLNVYIEWDNKNKVAKVYK